MDLDIYLRIENCKLKIPFSYVSMLEKRLHLNKWVANDSIVMGDAMYEKIDFLLHRATHTPVAIFLEVHSLEQLDLASPGDNAVKSDNDVSSIFNVDSA